MIDRQGIRDHLNSVQGYQGLIGIINCDAFGDCGAARITVVQNIGGEENAEASLNNVVFAYAPGTAGVGSEGLPLAEAVAAGLADVCPSPLVVQTDWFPESEHGALYELIGEGYEIDKNNGIIVGPMVLGGTDLGIDWEVRAGGPFLGAASVSEHMALDDSIHLGYASTDQQVNHWDVTQLVSVVAPLEKNPQMVMWDLDTYPDVTGIRDIGERGIIVQVFGGGTFPDVFIAQGIWDEDKGGTRATPARRRGSSPTATSPSRASLRLSLTSTSLCTPTMARRSGSSCCTMPGSRSTLRPSASAMARSRSCVRAWRGWFRSSSRRR